MWNVLRRTALPVPSTLVLPAVALLILLAGCAGTTRIGTLLDDPSQFDGEQVRVRGQVTEALGLAGAGGYRLDDGTGTLTVVSEGGGAPRRGADVEVEGVFHAVFTLGDRSLSVLEETERSVP